MPRLFLGNLGYDCRSSDIEKLFKGYGDIRNVNIKGKFGFLEIEDKDDAEDAIKDLNGTSFNGNRIRIEYSNASGGGGGRRYSSRSRSKSRDSDGRRFSDGRYRKSDYRVIVNGLSSRTSWQDLKDYMGRAGEVLYTSVRRPRAGEGLVEFRNRDGMERAIKDLDDTKLDGNYIRIESERRSRSRSRSRSRDRRSRSRSRDRRSRSRSRDRRSRSRRSRSRSRSRS
eukprot:TRINITY_DN1503_c0_g3_i1.p1 TRINITY_DN1503_c0_g3~~TRINITY_DN1503_c0_g3_i1.p1  ORF type:complete len:226 (-),score=51.22 TRINITY_DN1503_c0_g3_i1:389-1066(-)